MHWISGAWGGSLIYAGTTTFLTGKCGVSPNNLPVTKIIQKRRLVLFGHLVRMDESADAGRILTAVPQSDWRRPVGWPYNSWMATLKNVLSLHNLTMEDAIELAADKPLWIPLAASGATHWWCMLNNDVMMMVPLYKLRGRIRDGEQMSLKMGTEDCTEGAE